ncbi:MAG: hypothetical protein WBA17_11255, partial [Saprospiraceae bacterium]
DVGCGMWDVGCGMWDVGCGMWDVGCGMWDTSILTKNSITFKIFHDLAGIGILENWLHNETYKLLY